LDEPILRKKHSVSAEQQIIKYKKVNILDRLFLRLYWCLVPSMRRVYLVGDLFGRQPTWKKKFHTFDFDLNKPDNEKITIHNKRNKNSIFYVEAQCNRKLSEKN
jgi:hypothetical protein